MLAKTFAAAVQGIDAITVTVEVVVDKGVGYTIVGLPDTAVKEAAERIQTALSQSGQEWPRRHTVVNLSPADVRKEGASYDLPMAVGILAANEKLPTDALSDYILIGELSLDGTILPVKGVLPMAIMARKAGFKGMIVPRANETEAAVVNDIDIYGAENLAQVIDFFNGKCHIEPTIVNTREEFAKGSALTDLDFSDVKGQENVKRAFEVACAGGHNILLVGPPGSGKSMMAKRIPSIMPPLTLAEALETTKIHSVAGKLGKGSMLMTARPFRSPHHTISPVALVGGGASPMPGEISLAHNGVLFLDEFPEYSRSVLEVLRQPLEDRTITVSRAKYSVDYPAGFMLVASMNPCPCGYYTHPTRECTCAPGAVARYKNRISGPLFDRIDIQVFIDPVPIDELAADHVSESSEEIRRRIVRARQIQTLRFAQFENVHTNAQMNSKMLRQYCRMDAVTLKTLTAAIDKFQMSARAYDRILRVARTIADLEYGRDMTLSVEQAAEKPILQQHISEAIGYRGMDRANWGTTLPVNS